MNNKCTNKILSFFRVCLLLQKNILIIKLIFLFIVVFGCVSRHSKETSLNETISIDRDNDGIVDFNLIFDKGKTTKIILRPVLVNTNNILPNKESISRVVFKNDDDNFVYFSTEKKEEIAIFYFCLEKGSQKYNSSEQRIEVLSEGETLEENWKNEKKMNHECGNALYFHLNSGKAIRFSGCYDSEWFGDIRNEALKRLLEIYNEKYSQNFPTKELTNTIDKWIELLSEKKYKVFVNSVYSKDYFDDLEEALDVNKDEAEEMEIEELKRECMYNFLKGIKNKKVKFKGYNNFGWFYLKNYHERTKSKHVVIVKEGDEWKIRINMSSYKR